MKEKIDYGILTAVPKEITEYLHACQDVKTECIGIVEYTIGTLCGKRVAMISTGIGTTCAAAVMAHLVTHFHPKAVFFTGTAAGIADNLQQGDIVVGTQAYEVELYDLIEGCKGTPYNKDNYLIHSFKKEIQPNIYPGDADLLKLANSLSNQFQENALHNGVPSVAKLHMGLLATINHFPLKSELYFPLKNKGTVAVSMEGSAIYQTSWLLDTPSLIVRGISNIYTEDGRNSNTKTSEIALASGNAAKFVMNILSALK
ncbi:MAG TPA: 5'-methylthioadenosine/S-adenosylhomocysteine nucleosidase [Gammaproteobacteria bacterium]|nr:5'-methylthioadenosine/S-adenosylhomocysteine nucleosidase [Gammaproteobacteria bacterium]